MKNAIMPLAVFLLVPLFLIAATSSAEYDPWADFDESGDIDIFDVVRVAGAYSTSGDPAKNVTIAGHANKLAYSVTTTIEAMSSFYSGWISVDGYSKATVCLYTNAVDNTYRLETRHHGGFAFYAEQRSDIGVDLVQTYDVPNEEVQIYVFNSDGSTRALNIDVYLVP